MDFVFWYWFIIAFAFIALEVFISGGTYLLWMGLAAVIVGIVSYFFQNLSLVYEGFLFGISSLASVLFWKYFLKERLHTKETPNHLNRRGENYIGTFLTLTSPLKNGHGVHKIGETQWRLKGPDLPEGARVRVVGLEGNALVVKEET